MGKKVVFGFLLIFLSTFVYAGLSINEPLNIYNLGDKLYVTVSGIIGSDGGNFNIDLVCNNITVNLAKIPARAFSLDEELSSALPYKILDKEDLEVDNLSRILGDCQIVASVGGQAVSSKSFLISNEVFINVNLDKNNYDPGEGITVKINATKANGDLIEGFAGVTGATTFNKAVSKGGMINAFSTSDTAEAGIYYLNISVYDMGIDGILNKGSMIASFEINQIPASLILSISDIEVTPGDELTIGADVLDQSGGNMKGQVSGKVVSPTGEEERIVFTAGDFISQKFPTNATAGTWKIQAFYDKIGQEKEIEVRELQKVELTVEDSILIIKNIGNVLYNKTIDVNIGNETKNLALNIKIGETRKFNLGAPKGEYDVSATDGASSISQKVILTGNAISIKDLKDVSFFKSFSIIWIFLILVFGGIGFILFRKFRKTKIIDEYSGKKNIFSRVFKRRNRSYLENDSIVSSPLVPMKRNKVVDLTGGRINSAESALVLKGEKYPSAVVSVSVKNYNKLSTHARESLLNIISGAAGQKGLIDSKDEHIFVIFCALYSKTYDNELLATKAAFKMWKELVEYNAKFKEKIEFNLGVNSGELVASKKNNKLEYTGVGNTVSLAKRISDLSSGKIMVSESIKKKLMRDLRVEKVSEIGPAGVYSVMDVRNREANEAKLKDLLRRG